MRNILLILADQLRADHLACYGNPYVQTPAIDDLANRGVRFDNFHVASPLCMPNRGTLLTGRLPSLHGIRRNGIPLSLGEKTFVEALAEAGYQTGLIGKAHFQPYGMFVRSVARPIVEARRYPGWPELYGCEDLDSWASGKRPMPASYYGFRDVELCLYHGDGVQGDYARWLGKKCPDAASLMGFANSLPPGRHVCRDAWRTRVPEELYSSAYIAERASAWLGDRAAEGEKGAPFFLMCSFPDPHHPFTPPGRYWDMYDPDRIGLPASFAGNNKHPLLEYIRAASASNNPLGNNHHPFAPSAQEARALIALTYGMISNVDAAIGSILDSLQATGLAEDTTVIFTSDHGDLMGDHGVFLKGPMHFRGLTRVPFIWSDGDHLGTVASSCGTLDIARSIAMEASVPAWNGLQGHEVQPYLAGEASANNVLIESESAQLTFGRPAPFKLRTLVTEAARLTYSNDPDLCELYDLQEDPGECHNLWQLPKAAELQESLTRQLMTQMISSSEGSPAPLASG